LKKQTLTLPPKQQKQSVDIKKEEVTVERPEIGADIDVPAQGGESSRRPKKKKKKTKKKKVTAIDDMLSEEHGLR
jgi:hypothetical protein